MSSNDTPPLPARDAELQHFPELIRQLDGGALAEELSDLVQKCVTEISDACYDRGGKHTSSMTLRLDFSMSQKEKIVEIGVDVQSKFPKAPRGRAGIFFADAKGRLTREDPRQRSMMEELEKSRRVAREAEQDRADGEVSKS